MFFAINEYGIRTYIGDVDTNQAYFCPACNAPVLRKCGDVVAHHFAHKARGICDPWHSGKMSAWHKEMQNLFPQEYQEVIVSNNIGERHIADAVFEKGSMTYVVEFQHSTISSKEFVSRTDFYVNQGYGVVWIFDFCSILSPKVLPKVLYYTEEPDTNWIRVLWPGRDRVKFLDSIDFSKYGKKIHIYFHVSTGKAYRRLIESDDFCDRESWNYIDPFHREQLFFYLDLDSFQSSREFYALPYSEESFYRKLRNAAKNQK